MKYRKWASGHLDVLRLIFRTEEGIRMNNYTIIEDRGLAIKKGISYLNDKDILLILGKGHEESIIIKT